jgi:hypothetical protein
VLHEKQQLTNLAGYLALMMPFLGAGMAIVGAIAVAPTRSRGSLWISPVLLSRASRSCP